MVSQYDEIYNILNDVDILSKEGYCELVSLYGEDIVNSLIEYLVKEDENNYYKFEFYFSNKYKELIGTEELNNYSIYVSDMSMFASLNEHGNILLLEELRGMVVKLEELFLLLGCDDSILGKRKTPWIEDKINYCLGICNDSSLLCKLEELFKKYNEIRKKIIEGNLRLVLKIAGDYRVDSLTNSLDIIQYGNIGLMRAVEKYDITKGKSFSTYAIYWIKEEISRNIRNIKYSTWVPEYLVNKNREIFNASSELSIKFDREATEKEVADYVNKSVEYIRLVKNLFLPAVSLNELTLYGDECIGSTLLEIIEDEKANVYDIVCRKEVREKIKFILESRLTKRECFVLMNYLGFYGEQYSIVQIAMMLGVSRQRVDQLKSSALKKVRQMDNLINLLRG